MRVICVMGFEVLFENVVCINLFGLILIFVSCFIGKLFCFNEVILNVDVYCVGLFMVVLLGLRLKLMVIFWVGLVLFDNMLVSVLVFNV